MPSTSYTPVVTAGLALAVRPLTSGGGEIAGETQVAQLLGPLTPRTPAFISGAPIDVDVTAATVEGPLGEGRAWVYRKAGPMVPAVRSIALLDAGYAGSGGGVEDQSEALIIGLFGPIAPIPVTGLEISMPVAPAGGGFGDGEALRRARSGPQTPTVQTTALLDVSFDISGGAKPGVSTGAFVAQRSHPFTPIPATTALIDASYAATGGAKTAETEATVRQLTGSKTPLPVSGRTLDYATEFTGGCWSRGSARWQMANYPTEAIIGGGIAGGGARIVTEITSRTIVRDPITIYTGGGGSGGGGNGGSQSRQADQSITLSIGGSSGGGWELRPEDENTGGGEEPIILGEYIVENADMRGTGGTQTIGKITYLDGEINYVILPGGPVQGGGQSPPHITIDIVGNYGTSASGGGTGIVSLVDPNYPGLGGGSGGAGDLNISIPSGMFNLNGANLADFLTINDHTAGGMPGGIYNPNPAPGEASAIFGNRGLHANLLSMTCSLDAEVDLTGLRAQLTLLSCTIDAFSPVIGNGVTQQVMVTNTQTTAISNYTDYPFNSYCEVNGVYFAASDTGLHQIDTGTDDSGQPISAGIRTGMMIFADPMQKRTFDAFTTMRSSGGLTLTIHVEEAARHAPVNISMIPRASAGLVKYRGILPKGLRGKTWQFELNNVDGSAFDFNDLSFLEVPATRRI